MAAGWGGAPGGVTKGTGDRGDGCGPYWDCGEGFHRHTDMHTQVRAYQSAH